MRQLHPSSVPVRSLSRSLNIGFLFFIVGVFASPGGAGANLLTIAVMVLAGILVGVVYEVAYYRRFRYELTGDAFDVRSGVLARREREVPLRRVQNVDVRQNVLQRALGIAAVHVETAGGGQTEVTLRFVDEPEAKRLQRQLRNGARTGETDVDGEVESRGTVPATGEPGRDERRLEEQPERVPDRSVARPTEETLLFRIQPKELAILSVFTIDPGASLLATIALSFASGFDPTTLVPVDALESGFPGTGLIVLAWVVFLFLLAAWVLSAILTFNRYYGFRLSHVGDELHYERGLFQRYSGSIPLDKVQTLTIRESIPYRWFGYGALAVETAGYAPGQSGSRGTESAIPLAERGRVQSLARSIESFEEGPLDPIPRRARERYVVRYSLLAAVILGGSYLLSRYTAIVEAWYVAAVTFLLVPIAAHLQWRNRGYRADDRYFLARTGFWRRTTKVVPCYRVQAIVDTRTIFQRGRRLANLTADTASSASFLGRAATAIDVDDERADALGREIEARLQDQLRERGAPRAIDTVSDEAEPPVEGDDRGPRQPADAHERSPHGSDDAVHERSGDASVDPTDARLNDADQHDTDSDDEIHDASKEQRSDGADIDDADRDEDSDEVDLDDATHSDDASTHVTEAFDGDRDVPDRD